MSETFANPRTLSALYAEAKAKPSPGQAWLEEVADLTCYSIATVRGWALGFSQPNALTRKVLSEHFGIPTEELFPTEE